MVEPQSKEKKSSTARRDLLIEHEREAQELWANENFNEANPDEKNAKKYFITFPYPYMNGTLHLGHAFSMSKCEFTARYKRLNGYNILWPFAFHCTGMPITAAANRLKSEISQGIYLKEAQQGSQYNIMKQMGIPEEEIPKFQDPVVWLHYFSPLSREHLKKFGVHVDWRRSFITTEHNPYYNSFIEWQFNILREQGRVVFGKRPSIFSIKDNQICADHDRSEGEGVNPQEYTLIKLKILEPFPEAMKLLVGRDVFLVAATLRPETMYGQTNCFILPSGVYGAFEMKNNEIFICSERSAWNMAYQGLTKTPEKLEKVCDVLGETIVGLPLKAPLSVYDKVYALPMLSISMSKGTGVVTSVPSDAPDDFAALRDLKSKPDFRKKFNVTEEMVAPFDPVPIIEIPGYSDLSAVKACDEFKISSQNDKEKLKEAKDKVYLKGFNEGILLIGKFKGTRVKDAKNLVRKEMSDQNLAEIYYEPESRVLSRTNEECIVSYCDQWYLNYSEEEWKTAVAAHVNSGFDTYNDALLKELLFTVDWLREWGCSRNFGMGTRLPWDKKFIIESLSDSTIYMAYYTVAHFLQGNLDGSIRGTLNIAYEDISHEDWNYVFRKKPYSGSSKIPEEKLKTMRSEFEYWYPMDLRCSGKDLIKNHLTMSLFNHAAIWDSDPKLWPRAYFCNGHVLVDGEKMSKSKGNFITMEQCINLYGSDASRIALADAGDSLDDANFTHENANNAILRLSTLETVIRETTKDLKKYRKDSPNEAVSFFDRVFENELENIYIKTLEAYENMQFREALKLSFFEMVGIRDAYKLNVGNAGSRKDLISKYLHYQLLLLYPIVPHFCEVLYKDCFYPTIEQPEAFAKFISLARYPEVSRDKIDFEIIKKYNYIKNLQKNVRSSYEKAKNSKQKAKESNEQIFEKCLIVFANEYSEWQKQVLVKLKNLTFDDKREPVGDWKNIIKSDISSDLIKKSLQFADFILDEYKLRGNEVLESKLPFNEKDLISKHLESIKKDAGVPLVELFDLNEAASLNTKFLHQFLSNTLPGKPQVVFV